MMRTVKKPEIRRQEILAGAMAVFARKGYEKTTIADIAGELGISQGLCYRYFASKEEIYDAVIDLYAELIAAENLKNRPQKQSIWVWVDSIPGRIGAMALAERENPQLYSVFHHPHNDAIHRALYWKVTEKLLPAVTGVLEQAMEAGEIPRMDCAATAAFGLYGQIGLLLTQGMDCGQAIRENWKRLLERKEI